MTEPVQVKRGDVVLVDLGAKIGQEQQGIRPCLVVQNDKGNKFSPTTIVVPLTTRLTRNDLPTHMGFQGRYKSVLMFEQIVTIDKRRIIKGLDHVSPAQMKDVDKTIKISLGVVD